MDIAIVPAMVNRVTYTGDLGYEIWVTPEYQRRALRRDHGGGRGVRHRQFRHARAAVAAAGKELGRPGIASSARSTAPFEAGARPLRRPEARTTSSAATRRLREKAAAASCAASRSWSSRRRRRARRRADLARRQGGRLGDVGRLRPLRRQSLAWATCRTSSPPTATAASRSRSSASAARRTISAEPLFDPEGARMRM